jgi:hypothetical protein
VGASESHQIFAQTSACELRTSLNLALSHSPFDHVGNANDYAGSIWLAPKAELSAMFGLRATAEVAGARTPEP